MIIDGQLGTRHMRPDDEPLPCTGSAGLMATLEVFGRPILRGNRSRIVLIAGELDARLDGVSGHVEATVLRFGMPADEAARTWVPNAAGKLLYITSFGAELFSVHRRDERTRIQEPAAVAPGEEILLGLRSHLGGTAEVVLIIELPK
jgi:hypothetical protein